MPQNNNLLGLLGLLNPATNQGGVNADAYRTPEEVEQARRYAERLISPVNEKGELRPVAHWTQGIAHILGALTGRQVYNAANAAANREINRGSNIDSSVSSPAPYPGNNPTARPRPAPNPNPNPAPITGAVTPPVNPFAEVNPFSFSGGDVFGPITGVVPPRPTNAPGPGAVTNNGRSNLGGPQPTVADAGNRNIPRPLRTNNPGGMNYGRFALANGAIGTDGRLAIFPDMETGYRAQEALLQSYMGRGLNTISSIINRWAPPNVDNNSTGAYIRHVSRALGIAPNQRIGVDIIPRLAEAMAHYESGRPVPRPNSMVVQNNAPPASVAVEPASGVSVRSVPTENITIPRPQPEQPPAPQPEVTTGAIPEDQQEQLILAQHTGGPPRSNNRGGQGNYDVDPATNLPIFDPSRLETAFRAQPPPAIPTPPPEMLRAWRFLPAAEQTAARQAWDARFTPRETKVQGGTYWVMPDGRSGFVPIPEHGEISTPNGPVQTITLYSYDGRRMTFVATPTGERQSAGVPYGGAPVIQGNPNAPPLQPNAGTPPPTPTPPPTGDQSAVTPPPGIAVENDPVINRNPFQTEIYQQGLQAHIEKQAREAASQQGVTNINAEINRNVENLPAAQQTLSVVNMIGQLLDTPQAGGRMTGALANQWLEFTRSANAILRQGNLPALFDEQIVSATEALQKLNTYLGSAAARDLTNRPTQFDFQAFLTANPGLSASDAGARLMVQILRGLAERNVALGQAAGQAQQNAAGTGNLANWQRIRNQIYDQHTFNIAQMIFDDAVRNNYVLPRGFRLGGMEYTGGPLSADNSWRRWHPQGDNPPAPARVPQSR